MLLKIANSKLFGSAHECITDRVIDSEPRSSFSSSSGAKHTISTRSGNGTDLEHSIWSWTITTILSCCPQQLMCLRNLFSSVLICESTKPLVRAQFLPSISRLTLSVAPRSPLRPMDFSPSLSSPRGRRHHSGHTPNPVHVSLYGHNGLRRLRLGWSHPKHAMHVLPAAISA